MKKAIFFLLNIMLITSFASCSFSKKIDINGNENTEIINYNGITYNSKFFDCADDDRTLIGHIENGAKVYSIGNADPPEFIQIVGRDNSGCFIKEGSKIPTSGTITKALIDPCLRGNNTKYLSDDHELSMLEKITQLTGEPQKFSLDNYYTEGNAFYYVYNNSNVSCNENYGGYIAYKDGNWIYSAPGSEREPGENNAVTITGIVIDDDELINEMCKTDLVKYIKHE